MQVRCEKCDKTVVITNTEHFPDYDIDHLACGHNSKKISRTFVESVSVSNSFSWTIIKEPLNELARAEKDDDYYKLLSYACTIFEYYGKQVLIWHFKKNDTPISKDRIKYLTLEAVIIMLYTNKLIDQSTHTKIIQVKDMRNDFIHEDYSFTYAMEDAKKMKLTSALAIECVTFMREIYNNMFTIPDALDVSTLTNETKDFKK